jgi:hypothetical protein
MALEIARIIQEQPKPFDRSYKGPLHVSVSLTLVEGGVNKRLIEMI